MADEKDRFGETMKLVERVKEDIYFAERDRELIEKLKEQLQRVDQQESKSIAQNAPDCWRLIRSRDLPWTVVRTAVESGWIRENSKR